MSLKHSEYAVVCKWIDTRRSPARKGVLALVVKADDANAALLAANTARPDMWETADGLYRETAVYPAKTVEASVGR